MTTPIYRLYKSGKNLLIRTNLDVDKSTNMGKCMVYNENEIKLSVDNITNTVNIIPLIKIEGIKFTSKSFDIEIKLVQSMVLNKEPEIMQTCMIKREVKNNTEENLLDSSDGEKIKTLESEVVSNIQYKMKETNNTEIDSEKSTQELNNQEQSIEASDSKEQSIEASDSKEQTNERQSVETRDNKEPSNEEQYVNETIKEKENENILDYEKNDDLEQSSIDLEEITINPDGEDSISIKNPKEIYEEIYRVARIKAKKMRAASIEAFLEAKRIKSQYVLDDIEDSDSEDYTDDEVIDF